MRLRVLTIFPEIFTGFLSASLLGKAVEEGLLRVELEDLREHTADRHRSVDDEPYGGGGGMVMLAEPWIRAVRHLDPEHEARRILLSPRGVPLTDDDVRRLATELELILMCGRYEGVDERVRRTVVDQEVSIGDFVLAGGEVAAMAVIEAISRQIPGVVGLSSSVEQDSFRHDMLDHPHYTRPREVEGLGVPEVLLSGDHAAIQGWRRREALRATLERRPDLLAGRRLEGPWLAAARQLVAEGGEVAARARRLALEDESGDNSSLHADPAHPGGSK